MPTPPQMLDLENARPTWRERLPHVLADHELLRQIGQGSYGGVWLAQNKVTKTFRAIKIVWRDAFDHDKPFLREFEAIKKFEPISRSHPGFIQILQVGELENAFYYIMELGDDQLDGTQINPDTYRPRTLGRYRSKTLPLDECVQVGINLTDCLSLLHSGRLIHRDIKPSNIIFVAGRPKLADIGLVASLDEAHSFVGTTGFIPPEGPVSPQSDIYSLGKLLYEISTGKDRLQFPELPDNITEDHTLLLELNQIILRACHPDPFKRYGSAAEMKKELELLQTGKSIKRLRQVEKNLRVVLVSLILLVFVAISAFVIFNEMKRRERLAAEQKQRALGSLLGKGVEGLKRGDFAAAYPHFVEASKIDPEHLKTHRLRLASLLAYAAKPIYEFTTASQDAVVSENGNWVAETYANELRLFVSTNNQASITIRFPADIVGLSHDGLKIALSNTNKLYLLSAFGESNILREFPIQAHHVSFHPVRDELAITHEGGKVELHRPGEVLPINEKFQVFRTRYSPSGNLLAVMGAGGAVSLWDTKSATPLNFQPKHNSHTYDALFIRSEQVIVTAGADRRVIAWDMRTGQQIGLDMEHDDAVVQLAASPEEKLLATGGLDYTVRLWEAATFRPLPQNHRLYLPGRVESLRFLDSEHLVVVCHTGKVIVWDVIPEKALPVEIKERSPIPDKLHLSAPGVDLAARENQVIGSIAGSVVEWKFPARVSALALSPTRHLIAVGTRDDTLAPHSVCLYDTNGVVRPFELRHQDGINHISFSPDGKKVATSGEDFTAFIWDVLTGAQLTAPMRHKHQVHWAAFSADGEWLATASWDETVIIWDANTGDPITPPLEFNNILEHVHFEESGMLIASNSRRQYRMRLPSLTGSIDSLLGLLITPNQNSSVFLPSTAASIQ